jgi:hypothetical protein
MATKIRLLAAFGALATAVIMVVQSGPLTPSFERVELRSTAAPFPLATTTIKWPVVETVDPSPFDACRDIPLDVIQRIGLDFTPPEPEDGLRCHFDAGNYQMAVESFVWRTYEESLPPDAVEVDIDGHRAAQYWVMKPTDWNNRWWISCMVAFKTDWGVIQQSLFYSPKYAADDVDCMQANLQRAHELAPYYRYTKRDTSQ